MNMTENHHTIVSISIRITAIMGFMWGSFVIPVLAQENSLTEIPGQTRGSGTYFEINHSDYLNVTLNSSEYINVRIRSVPEMITISLLESTATSSSSITLGGLLPGTTYYKYEDDYHNVLEFTTGAGGSYSYVQNISIPHVIFIQPRKSTKFLRDDATGGDCSVFGIWSITEKTCTLTQNLSETIQIDGDSITLDGNSFILSGSHTGSGIYLNGRSGGTIRNIEVRDFTYAISIYNSNNIHVENNNFTNIDNGAITLSNSHTSTITGNDVLLTVPSFNRHQGFILFDSYNNVFTDNTIALNIHADIRGGHQGILLFDSNNNEIDLNYVADTRQAVLLFDSYNNSIHGNTLTNNSTSGLTIFSPSSVNEVYNNNFINNPTSVVMSGGAVNTFNSPKPTGGNYWRNYDTSGEGCINTDNDNFCDSPFIFPNGQDSFPWIIQDGWKTQTNLPPTISGFNQYKSDEQMSIPEGDITTESSPHDLSKGIIVFKTTITDPGGDQVKLQVELKEFSQLFDGTNLLESNLKSSGDEIVITKDSLPEGAYHWRVRAVDDKGNASDWQEFGEAGNIDFEIKLVPLYTQIRSPYPSDAQTDEWDSLRYGAGNYPDCLDRELNIPTIRRCGCAIASVVMLGKYYDIDVGVDNTSTDPANINAWLTNNKGYTKNGRLYWGKAIEYLGFVDPTTNKKMARLSLDYHNATSTLPIVNSYIASAKPAIAYSSRFGHYFVIDGKLQDTYTIKDPRWYNTKKLNEQENLISEVRGYNNYFDTANLFSYLETPRKIAASLYISLASPAELLVTDPQGKRLGKDSISGEVFNEIGNSSYTEEGPAVSSDTPLDPNQTHKTKIIYIPTPIDGTYTIRVIGTDTGSYTIDALLYDNEGNPHEQTLTGNTQENLVADYNLNFTPDTPGDIGIGPTDITPPVISHTVLSNNYILNSPPISFEFSAQDTGVGVYRISATLDGVSITDGHAVSFDRIGFHTIEIQAEDFVGNILTQPIVFSVVYGFGGFLPPIKLDGTGVYKLGRTLPIKFQLTDVNSQYISTAVAKLYISKISNGVAGTNEIVLSTSNADTGNTFRYDQSTNQYIYNLSTNTLAVGSWQLKISSDDGQSHTVLISIK